jgi:hypothetical protein
MNFPHHFTSRKIQDIGYDVKIRITKMLNVNVTFSILFLSKTLSRAGDEKNGEKDKRKRLLSCLLA